MRAVFFLWLLLISFPLFAGELTFDVRCFSDSNRKIQLEFRTYQDEKIGWVGGQVRYKRSAVYIPLVFSRSETLDDAPNRPWEFRHHWLEIVEGAVNGEYQLSSQGALVYDFSYTNKKSGKTVLLSEQSPPDETGVCIWP